jgi:hypothetical protein
MFLYWSTEFELDIRLLSQYMNKQTSLLIIVIFFRVLT